MEHALYISIVQMPLESTGIILVSFFMGKNNGIDGQLLLR